MCAQEMGDELVHNAVNACKRRLCQLPDLRPDICKKGAFSGPSKNS